MKSAQEAIDNLVARLGKREYHPPQFTDEGWLICAACGEFYLHHQTVEIFERDGGEDSATGLHVIVGGTTLKADANMNGNPSARRDGVKIRLACESCDAITVLCISQHKGNTEMYVTTEPGNEVTT